MVVLGIAPELGLTRGRLLDLEREREEGVLVLDACRWGRVPVVVVVFVVVLTGTLFFLSGHARFHAWWPLWQFGHFATTDIPLRCFSVHSWVECWPAHTPQVSLP